MDFHSVYAQARKAMDEHKWIESEKVGRDLGHMATRQWARAYWLQFYRHQLVQHLKGNLRCKEFAESSFGVVSRFEHNELIDGILGELENGAENLDLILTSREHLWPMEQVLAILAAVDINSKRLAPPCE